MTTPKIYLSGPMTGLPNFNHDAFHTEAARLRGLGYEVVNPAELNPDTTASRADCLRRDIAALLDCTTLALLPGWKKSRGALLEYSISTELGIDIMRANCINRKGVYQAEKTDVAAIQDEALHATQPQPITATQLLTNAAAIMAERGKQYDQPGGERSMGKCVAAFNTITGQSISEAEGWLLLQLLKDVRQWQRPGYHADSAEDCIAYAALKAEAKQQDATG